MPEKSPFPPLDLPSTDLLTWLYPSVAETSHLPTPPLTSSKSQSTRPDSSPIFHDAAQPSHNLNSTQLLTWIQRLGGGLRNLGLKKGDVVLVMSTNHIFMPVLYLGAAGFGYVYSGVNPGYGVEETAYQITNTGAAVFLCEKALLKVGLPAAEKAGLDRGRVFVFGDGEVEDVEGLRDWRRMLVSEEEARGVRWKALSAEEARGTTAVINATSVLRPQ